MRVPFTEVVEPRVLASGAVEKSREPSRMLFWLADETRAGTPLALNRELDNPEFALGEMFAQEKAPGLIALGLTQFGSQTARNITGND